ncbi:hypothetical protein [Priestia megaterium]|uniref:hypothetical protein n=1 Tax=Priestia megaterium TaxID=1404 RepID=UPI003CC598B8
MKLMKKIAQMIGNGLERGTSVEYDVLGNRIIVEDDQGNSVTLAPLSHSERIELNKEVKRTYEVAKKSIEECLKNFEEYQREREISALKHAIELKDLEINAYKKLFDQFRK